MLSKKYPDGESSGMVHVSISIANDEVDNNIDTVGKAKGLKTKNCPRKTKRRYKSWLEKEAKKTKMHSEKKKKSQEGLVQSLPVRIFFINLLDFV